MDRSELEIIKELMAELEDKMQPGKDDFEERLGRKKPGVEVLKVEGQMPGDGMDMDDDSMMAKGVMGKDMPMGMDDKDDDSMGMRDDMSSSDMPMMDDDMMSPDEKLKARLMKMRA